MSLSEHAAELAAQCIKRPSSFAMWDKLGRVWFEPGQWGFSPLGTHRDADTLTRSNWEVITADLLKRFPDSFLVFRTSHWAVGWYDHLAVNAGDVAAMEALTEWVRALEAYPVASDDHFSELEFNEACEYWARLSVRERAELIRDSDCGVSIFAARRDELPRDDNGYLQEALRC